MEKEFFADTVPTGFMELDMTLNFGLQNSNLYVLAGRPNMGKTSLMLNLCSNMVENEYNPLIFSFEMTKKQILSKLISIKSKLSYSKIMRRNLDAEEEARLNLFMLLYEDRNFIEDSNRITLNDISNIAREYKKEELDIIFIDDIQRISLDKESLKRVAIREQEVSIIAQELKSLAKELNVPVFALSQMNRQIEYRQGNYTPIITDLKDSGAIEYNSDVIMFIYRKDYYDFYAYGIDDCHLSDAELVISKNRYGSLSKLYYTFDKAYSTFKEYESNPLE